MAKRDPKLESYWRTWIKRQASSKLTPAVFCRKYKISKDKLFWWRLELKRRDAAFEKTRSAKTSNKAQKYTFFPVEIVPDAAGHLDNSEVLNQSANLDGKVLAELMIGSNRLLFYDRETLLYILRATYQP